MENKNNNSQEVMTRNKKNKNRSNNMSKIIINVSLISFLILAILWKFGPNYGIFIIPPAPIDYGNYIIKKLDKGIGADSKEWEGKKEELRRRFNFVHTYDDIDEVVGSYLDLVGGRNSIIQTRVDKEINRVSYEIPIIELKDEILYIKLPSLKGTRAQERDYSNRIGEAIGKKDYKGLIIDLRSNEGGPLGPILVNFAPFLPEGKVMTLDFGHNKTKEVKLDNGSLNYNDSTYSTSFPSFKMEVPIVILQGGKTKDSAEVFIIAFKGLSNVKSIGEDTGGSPLIKENSTLLSGNTLILSVGKALDRSGKVYEEEGIKPDISVAQDRALIEAKKFLKEIIK